MYDYAIRQIYKIKYKNCQKKNNSLSMAINNHIYD